MKIPKIPWWGYVLAVVAAYLVARRMGVKLPFGQSAHPVQQSPAGPTLLTDPEGEREPPTFHFDPTRVGKPTFRG